MQKKIKSMLSIMLISTLSFTAVGCGNEASQEGVSAVFGTMESEDEVVDNINDTSEPQVVAENSDTQSTEEDTQVNEDTQVEENNSQETSSESSEDSKDNSNAGSSKEYKPSESHKDNRKDDRPSETHKDDKKDDNHEEHKHTHTWKPVYKTIHHKAVTHKEDKGHYEDEGYDVWVESCSTCGKEFTTNEALCEHQRVSREKYPNAPDKWHVGSSTYSKHVEKKVWVHKWVTVVDKEAWDEKVLDHYECSCGATKKK